MAQNCCKVSKNMWDFEKISNQGTEVKQKPCLDYYHWETLLKFPAGSKTAMETREQYV